MTLLVTIMLTIEEKSFFTLKNVGACLWSENPYLLKKCFFLLNMFYMVFSAQFQIQTCFETVQAVWVPKHLCP